MSESLSPVCAQRRKWRPLGQWSPTPRLWTCSRLQPVRNQAAQQEVSNGQGSEASSAAPHRSPSLALPPEPSLALPPDLFPHPPHCGKIVSHKTGPWCQKVVDHCSRGIYVCYLEIFCRKDLPLFLIYFCIQSLIYIHVVIDIYFVLFGHNPILSLYILGKLFQL